MVERLTSGVFRVPTGGRSANNVFLVRGEDGLTLVDAGFSRSGRAVLSAVEALNRSPSDVRRIVVTHAHPDHVRGLAALREATGATVQIHAGDADWLAAGGVPVGGRSSRLGGLVDRLPVTGWTPVATDEFLTDQQIIPGSDGLRVLHTPGHTAGHVALLHEPTRTLLTGDAVFGGRSPSMGPTPMALDPQGARDSLARLPIDVDAVGFAHGAPLFGRAVVAYQRMHSTGGSR